VDFEHERREEVFQYIYGKYGRDHAAIAGEVITYRGRLAVREVGKALGLSLDRVDAIAKAVDSWGDESALEQRLREVGLDPSQRTLRCLVRLVRQIIGFPRHLSQHVGGFVISRGPLCDLVPIANAAMPDRTFVEWDKNDIDALGILKVDCLALGMLTALHKCFDFLREHHGVRMGLADVPAEDAGVYRMIQRADTVGVFQIESRAQMSMLPRLKPACFYDLVIEVAIVRPGPIQGDMVHPYLRRRKGLEAETYPNEAIRAVLGKTLGVPLFQEQAMRLAMVAAGFGPGQADALRRAMGAWRKRGLLEKFRKQLLEGMRRNGLPEAFARRTFEQIRGFGEYGFPESHAASFALLVYVSAWLKRYWPAAYCAALMNSQPMGFYAPAQLVQDAKRHGVDVRPVDVNFSGYDCRLEGNASARPAGADDRPETWGGHGPAIRLGMRLVRGLSAEQAVRIEEEGRKRRFGSVGELARRGGIGRAGLAKLAAADAFGSMSLDRRQAMWQVLRQGEALPLLAGLDDEEPVVPLPDEPREQSVAYDYHHVGLSLKVHPMALRREELARRGVVEASRLVGIRSGRRVAVAGLVTVRQRPSTARGIVFMTLEDETGVANLLVRPEVYEKYRKVARSVTGMVAAGKLERSDGVIHVVVDRMVDLADDLGALPAGSRDFR